MASLVTKQDVKLLPIPRELLVGKLQQVLSYQFAIELKTREKRLEECARRVQTIRERGWKKNMRLLAEIPAREYFRIQQQVDPDFFKDRKNIRKLVQDYPELKGGVGT